LQRRNVRICQRIVDENSCDCFGSHRVGVRQQVRIGAEERLRIVAPLADRREDDLTLVEANEMVLAFWGAKVV